MTVTDAAFPLAGVPGFHGLARTALVGTAGPGGVVLDVYCACENTSVTPVAQITARLNKSDAHAFRFTELGGGKIALAPGLDLRTDHGHFITDSPWVTAPDGWMRLGPIDGKKIAAVKKALRPTKAVKAAATEIGSSDTKCGCGHERGFHDPCSKCECSGFHMSKKGAKAERFKKRATT